MKKKAILISVILILTLSAGCRKTDDSETESLIIEKIPVDSSAEDKSIEEPVWEEEFCFADLSDRLFSFSSGAGAWSTELYINSDGSFEGLYNDSDMGSSGEGYPEGTRYSCSFKGRFDSLEKIDEFTFKMKLAVLELEEEPGKEEVLDGVRYIYSTAYGLDDGEEFYLYLPGAKLAQLPEEYRSWVGYYDLERITETELPFYGLYNINAGNGFSSCEYKRPGLSERIAKEISSAEEKDARMGVITESDTRAIYEGCAELLQVWDDTLNIVWKMLENELDNTSMETLREEERSWIARKEEQVKAAGQKYEGGTMQQIEEVMEAIKLTKERVYELAEYAQ